MNTTTLYVPSALAEVRTDECVLSISLEQDWLRINPLHFDTSLPREDIFVARSTHILQLPITTANDGIVGDYCIGLNIKCIPVASDHAGQRPVRALVTVGAVLVTAPRKATKAVSRYPANVIHLFSRKTVLVECFHDFFQRTCIALNKPQLVRSLLLECLGQTLAISHRADSAVRKTLAESVGRADVFRIALHFARKHRRVPEAAFLQQWRMHRITELLDEHLAASIRPVDIVSSVELSRVHLAAQVDRAAGFCLRECLLYRRIEHARHLPRTSGCSAIEVALSCGFRPQPHLTTVFKRFVGETPHRQRVRGYKNGSHA